MKQRPLDTIAVLIVNEILTGSTLNHYEPKKLANYATNFRTHLNRFPPDADEIVPERGLSEYLAALLLTMKRDYASDIIECVHNNTEHLVRVTKSFWREATEFSASIKANKIREELSRPIESTEGSCTPHNEIELDQ